MFRKIIVTVGVSGNRVIAHAYYRFDYGIFYFLIDRVVNFKPHEYSKHLFSIVGKGLGEDLALRSKRNQVSLPEDICVHNGANFIEASDELMEVGFEIVPVAHFPQVTRIGREKPIGGDEMQAFCSAFHRGLKVKLSSVGINGNLYEFAYC